MYYVPIKVQRRRIFYFTILSNYLCYLKYFLLVEIGTWKYHSRYIKFRYFLMYDGSKIEQDTTVKDEELIGRLEI